MKFWHYLLLGAVLAVVAIGLFLSLAMRLWIWISVAMFAVFGDFIIIGVAVFLFFWVRHKFRKWKEQRATR